ncbi:MAG: replication initiator protein [Microvirus sp.]|nr:MAG: replication initiator protein [Microvirus sp.]
MVFHERGKIRRSLELRCGRCIGCRLSRAQMWSVRCVHEAQMHENSIFVTLTYSDEFLPGPSLLYVDYQLFMKRLRESVGPVRFFMCGEYGEENLRPHFHALLFGVDFEDRKSIGSNLYTSATLEKIWGKGHCPFGSVTKDSAAYVARYSVKKVNGEAAKDHYSRVDSRTGEIVDCVPEFGRMSLRPGIGYTWFAKYWRDVYAARDGVVVDGTTVTAPRYYDDKLCDFAGDLIDDKKYERYLRSLEYDVEESSLERLAVQEVVAKAGLDFYTKRNL